MSKHSRFANVAGNPADDGHHKVFSKEVSGRKVVDSLFKKLLSDPSLQAFWGSLTIETINHQQDVMMEIAFGAGLLEEDKTYLKEVHAEAIQYNGLTVKHFEKFCQHFEATLKELSHIIPHDKIKEAIQNMKACEVIFKVQKK